MNFEVRCACALPSSDIKFQKIDFINLGKDILETPDIIIPDHIFGDIIIKNDPILILKDNVPSNAQNLKISVISDQEDIDFVVNQFKTNRDFDFDFTKFKSSEIDLQDLNSSYKIVRVEFKEIPESLIGKEIFENFDVKGVLKGYSLIPLNFEYSSKMDLNNDQVSDINCSVNSINIFDKKNDSIDSHLSDLLEMNQKINKIINEESFQTKTLDLNLDLKIENNFYKSNLHFDGMIYLSNESIFIRDFHIDIIDQENGKECMNVNLKNEKINPDDFFENQIENFIDFNLFSSPYGSFVIS